MSPMFKEGDFVKFVGEDGCDVTFGCNAEMEDTLCTELQCFQRG